MNLPIPLRNQVSLEQTWNAASIFPTREAWLAAFKVVEQRISSN